MDHLINITVLKVLDAGHLLGKEAPSHDRGMSQEARNFLDMTEKLNTEAEDLPVVKTPLKGKLYAGYKQAHRKWYRVVCDSVCQTTKGPHAKCFMVDWGEREMIPGQYLHELPLSCSQAYVPYQAKEMFLAGVTPVTYKTCPEDMTTTKQPCKVWDSSATEWIQHILKVCQHLMAEVVQIDENGKWYIRLFVNTAEKEHICINDELVRLEYAMVSQCEPEKEAPEASIHQISPGTRARTLDSFVEEHKFIEELRERQKQQLREEGVGRQSEGISLESDGIGVKKVNVSDNEDDTGIGLRILRKGKWVLEESLPSKNTEKQHFHSNSRGSELGSQIFLAQANGSTDTVATLPKQIRQESGNLLGTGNSLPSHNTMNEMPSYLNDRNELQTSITNEYSHSSGSSTESPSSLPSHFQHQGLMEGLSRHRTSVTHGPGACVSMETSASGILSPQQRLQAMLSPSTRSPGIDNSKSGPVPPNQRLQAVLSQSQTHLMEPNMSGSLSPNQKLQAMLSPRRSHETDSKTSSPLSPNQRLQAMLSPCPTSPLVHQNQGILGSQDLASKAQSETFSPNQRMQPLNLLPQSTSHGRPQEIPTNRMPVSSLPSNQKQPQLSPGLVEVLSPRQTLPNSPHHSVPQKLSANVPQVSNPTRLQSLMGMLQNNQPFASAAVPEANQNQHGCHQRAEGSGDSKHISTTSPHLETNPNHSHKLDGSGDQKTVNTMQATSVSYSPENRGKKSFQSTSVQNPDPTAVMDGVNTRAACPTPITPASIVPKKSTQQNASPEADPSVHMSMHRSLGGAAAAIQDEPLIARKPKVAFTKGHALSEESRGSSLVCSGAKPSKSILKKKRSSTGSNVSFSESDQEQGPRTGSPRTPGNSRKAESPQTYGSPKNSGSPSKSSSPRNNVNFESRSRGDTSDDELNSADQSFEMYSRYHRSPLISQEARMFGLDQIPIAGVLLDGARKPKPVTDLNEAGFADVIKMELHKQAFPGPTIVQAHSWPAMSRLGDTVVVAPSGSGKAMAYLLPVIDSVLNTSNYEDVPDGNGPLALIVLSSWKKAHEIYHWCKKFIEGRRNARTLVIYGGGNEDNQVIPLINGCEILIATPYCLDRMLRHEYTNLNRLCHLVFDDANILMEEFTKEVRHVMSLYGNVIKNQFLSAPRQVCMFGSEWTPGMESFRKAYMNAPLIIITSKLEASVYGKAKQVVHMCHSPQRDENLIGLLDTFIEKGQKCIIFTSQPKSAMHIYQLLQSQSRYSLLAHSGLTDYEVNEVKREWDVHHREDSMPVLVAEDACIPDLDITNATCVVHYDIPTIRAKGVFADRMGCMMDNYKQENTQNLISHILVTEQCAKQASALITVLKRSGSQVPQKLIDLAAGALEGKEEAKKEELCHYFKAYGKCRIQNVCKYRHLISKDMDGVVTSKTQIELPKYGEVKIQVTHVVDATCFYGRLLEHQALDSPIKSMTVQYAKLEFDLAMHFAYVKNRVMCESLAIGDICILEKQDTFHRVRVEELPSEITKETIKVFLVDQGKVDFIHFSQLLKMPNEFMVVPFQAVEMFICYIKPVDEDTEWTHRASEFVYQCIHNQQLYGKIVLSLGNTLWLDPLVKRVKLTGLKLTSNEWNLRKELLRNDLAVANKTHMESLYEACRGKVTLPDIPVPTPAQTERLMTRNINFETLPDGEELHEVYISAIITPELFYVHRKEYDESLENLMDELNLNTEKILKDSNFVETTVGTLVLARFTEDKRWYRGQILAARGPEVQVFYIDYGEREWITFDDVRSMPEEVLDFPFSAIECSLEGLAAPEGKWPPSSGDKLFDLTHDQEDAKLPLFAKVVSKSPALYAGKHKYNLKLYDRFTTQYNIDIGQELINLGQAVSITAPVEELVQEIPGEIYYKYPYQRLPDLCSALRRAEDDTVKLAISRTIKDTVHNCANFRNEIRELGCIRLVCRALEEEKNENVQQCLIVCLTFICCTNNKNIEEVHSYGGLETLCRLLKETCNPTTEENITWALRTFAAVEKNCQAIRDHGGVFTLYELLKTSQDETIKENTCMALDTIVTNCPRVCDLLQEYGAVSILVQLLQQPGTDTSMEHILGILGVMAKQASCKHSLDQSGCLAAVCDILKHISDDTQTKLIQPAVAALLNMAANDKANKAAMMKLKVRHTLKRLCESPSVKLPNKTRRTCMELINRLGTSGGNSDGRSSDSTPTNSPSRPQGIVSKGIKMPQELLLKPLPNLPPLEAIQGKVQRVEVPNLRWAQNKTYVTLSVQLREVKRKKISISGNIFKFSTTVNCKYYELNLELFGNVNKCRVSRASGMEVLVSLRKQEKTRWPRLLQQKEKPSNISVDFDRFNDSSSDGDSDDDRPFIVKPLRGMTFGTTNAKSTKEAIPAGMEGSCSSHSSSEEYSSNDEQRKDPYAWVVGG